METINTSLPFAQLNNLCYTIIPVWLGFFDEGGQRFQLLLDPKGVEPACGTGDRLDRLLSNQFYCSPRSNLTLHIFAEGLGDTELRALLFWTFINQSTPHNCWLLNDMGNRNRICVVDSPAYRWSESSDKDGSEVKNG